ncbi:MAG: CvpA family protein [Muribaculaceae bacterium]|nr:CvpA family protein [Muribaculaceae bacterium]
MSSIDLLIVAVFATSILFGIWKGLIAQLGIVGGIVGGIIACRLVGDPMATLIGHLTGADKGSSVDAYIDSMVANIIIFAVVFTTVVFLSRMMRIMASAMCLSVVDRVGGMLFSLFSWLLALSLLMNIWQMAHPGESLANKGELNHGRAVRSMLDFAPDILGSESPRQLFMQH